MPLQLETQAARAEDAVDDPTAYGLAGALGATARRSVEAVPVEPLTTETLVAEVFGEGIGEGSTEGLAVEEGRQQVALTLRLIDEARLEKGGSEGWRRPSRRDAVSCGGEYGELGGEDKGGGRAEKEASQQASDVPCYPPRTHEP